MKTEALKKIFDFIKDKDNKRHKKDGTLEWKLLFNEPLTEEDLNVKGDLKLEKTKITTLPEGLKVGGNLNLVLSQIKSLPKGLEVDGDLNLSYSKIESLPKGLQVGEDLNIMLTTLTKYSDKELREMIKPGFIKGKIYRK